MKKYLFLLLSLCSLASCRELVVLDLPDEPARLVVEAELTDTPGPHSVRLSLTQDYFSEEELPPVTDALVRISDNAGNEETLIQLEPGHYITQSLTGVIGRNYKLHISWNQQEYESSGTLLEEAIIDSLDYRYFPENPVFSAGYYIIAHGTIPPDRDNFFRFKVYENDSLYNGRSDLFIQSDEFLGDTEKLSLRFPYPFGVQDTVALEMYTLNKDMYQYYQELLTLLYNDGGLFSPPPQNPVSNIRNMSNPDQPPLGYFQVASVTSGVVIIEDQEH